MSTINLLPEDYVQRCSQHRANILCIALFATVMAGVGAAALISEQSLRHTQRVRDQVNASYAEAAKQITQMRELQAQKRTRIRKAQATLALLERVPRSYLLAVLARALPENASLMKLELKQKARLPVQAVPPAGKKKLSKFAAAKARQSPRKHERTTLLAVTGVAATDVEVAAFIANLLRSPLLTAVDLSYSEEKIFHPKKKGLPDLKLREFKVIMEVRPGVDVIDLVRAEATHAQADLETEDDAEGAS